MRLLIALIVMSCLAASTPALAQVVLDMPAPVKAKAPVDDAATDAAADVMSADQAGLVSLSRYVGYRNGMRVTSRPYYGPYAGFYRSLGRSFIYPPIGWWGGSWWFPGFGHHHHHHHDFPDCFGGSSIDIDIDI